MKRNHLFGIAASLMLSGAAYADSYQSEVGADVVFLGLGDDQVDSDYSYRLRGTVHFSPVETGGLPLAEAPFLNRSSNVHFGVVEDANQMSVGAEYYLSDAMLYFGATGVRYKTSQGSDTSWSLALGVTPIDGLRISTSVSEGGYDPNINAKYVMPIGERRALNIEANYYRDDVWEDSWGLAGDFYFTPSFSLGATYDDYGLGFSQESIRARLFFTPALSGELVYTNGFRDNWVQAGVALRF